MTPYEQAQHTHQLYCTLTGLALPFTMDLLWKWELFTARFSDEDLKMVIRLIKDKVKHGKPARSLNFRNLIAGPESLAFFAEDLAEAKARNRATRTDTDRASVLRATGRRETQEKPVRTAEQILAGNEALKQFLKLKETL